MRDTRKNPAAGRFSDIIPLRRSAILPGGLFTLQKNATKFPVKHKKTPPLQNFSSAAEGLLLLTNSDCSGNQLVGTIITPEVC